MKKNLLVSVLLGILILPTIASAQVTITGMVVNVSNVIYTIGGILVIVFWVIVGVLFLAAQGAPEKLTTAKKALFAAIGGTAIVILAWSASAIISSAIFQGV
ncbi:MAG: hypothetical protein AAB925_02035 [Patescibacteria group bacterium]